MHGGWLYQQNFFRFLRNGKMQKAVDAVKRYASSWHRWRILFHPAYSLPSYKYRAVEVVDHWQGRRRRGALHEGQSLLPLVAKDDLPTCPCDEFRLHAWPVQLGLWAVTLANLSGSCLSWKASSSLLPSLSGASFVLPPGIIAMVGTWKIT
ncbi:hypothetical protein BS78_06G073800 [Paspalum vaginatum]|nr:hypothetical protein BS78_06G073800 [Paspalum vaginatum]KAJ1270728.1 hypothetical protein BS78_06G073800 [Paspalum vaginatum]KAJ1270729.1 hypothetical protein BS78_06G073800 [Paspalum vaginatum]KAJ1270731.1 hypothetical protein BS78_06G073800 [Paspalum vaginatum]